MQTPVAPSAADSREDLQHDDSDVKSAGVIGRASLILTFKGVSGGLGVLSAVLLARALGTEGRGTLAAATAGPLIMSLVIFFGFGVANVYFLARQELEVPVAIGTSLASSVLLGFIGGAVYVGIGLAVRESMLQGLPASYVWLGGLLVPAVLSVRYISAVTQGLQRVALFNSIQVTQWAVAVLLYIAVLYVLRLGALAAFGAYVAAVVIGVVPALVILTREHGPWRVDVGYARKAVRFGARGEASTLIAYLGYRVDLVIVTALVGFSAAGKYAVSFTLAEILWVLPNALAVMLFPSVAADRHEADTSLRTTTTIARMTYYILVIGGLLGVLLSPWLVPRIFSEAYWGSVLPLQILVPGVVLFGLGKVLTADLAGRGRPGVATISHLIGLGVMVGLDFVLIPNHGIVGAAIASSFAYALAFLIQLVIFMRITRAKASDVLVPNGADLIFARGQIQKLFADRSLRDAVSKIRRNQRL